MKDTNQIFNAQKESFSHVHVKIPNDRLISQASTVNITLSIPIFYFFFVVSSEIFPQSTDISLLKLNYTTCYIAIQDKFLSYLVYKLLERESREKELKIKINCIDKFMRYHPRIFIDFKFTRYKKKYKHILISYLKQHNYK